ncbi:MAG: hypothetical protein ACREQV_23050, partial [Candidatus Binatia bacterium]
TLNGSALRGSVVIRGQSVAHLRRAPERPLDPFVIIGATSGIALSRCKTSALRHLGTAPLHGLIS